MLETLPVPAGKIEHTARILDRLSEELQEAAAMLRGGQPPRWNVVVHSGAGSTSYLIEADSAVTAAGIAGYRHRAAGDSDISGIDAARW